MKNSLGKRLLKAVYEYLIIFLARPNLQYFYEKLFRILIGFLGYMNWSGDFKLTGEKKLLKIISEYKLNSILDIGANSGQWADMALNVTPFNVISVEPQSIPYGELSSLLKKYPGRFNSFNLALGSTKKDFFINVNRNSSELSYIDNNLNVMPLLKDQSIVKEKIMIITLDDLYSDNIESFNEIGFVKIDVEGYEMEVIIGAQKFLQEVKPDFIQIEMNWHQIYTNTTMYKFSLLLPDYDIFKILPAGAVLYKIDANYPINNLFQLSNFLFVRKSFNFKFSS
jgi:FkbM family methyltransferase